MFLSMLNETQKKLFLDFAHHMASIDGNYSNEEKELVKSYCREMQIAPDFERKDLSIEEILKEIKEISSAVEKK